MDRDAEFLLFVAHERIRRAQRGAEFARLAAQAEAAAGARSPHPRLSTGARSASARLRTGARSAHGRLRTGARTVRVRTGTGLVRLGAWIAGIPATVPTQAANRPTPC
jgi:hypothetical protein